MRVRRHFSQRGWKLPSIESIPWPRLPSVPTAVRTAVGAVGAIGAAFGVGYLVVALFVFPAPLLPSEVRVPRLVQMDRGEAIALLRENELRATDGGREAHDLVPAGRIVWQDPPPGTTVPQGGAVDLITSNGPASVSIPDVRDLDGSFARRIITAAGLRVRAVDSIQAPAPAGVAVVTRPGAGTLVTRGTSIRLVVSRGEPIITVPHVIGLTQGDALVLIEEAGLTLGSSWGRVDSLATPGLIVEQQPSAGTLAAPGTPVDLIFARREPLQ